MQWGFQNYMTNKKQAKVHNKASLIFDYLTDIIILCDKDFTILESNRPADVILGKGEHITQKKCYQLLRNQPRQCPDCPLNATIKSGIIVPLVYYDQRYNEYFEERTHPILSDEQDLQGFVLTSRNITKMKEFENRSAQFKKLSALGEISAGVAHDFNNILTIVLGRVQLMKRMFDDPKLAKNLEKIEVAVKDGADKVRKIQEFASPEKKGEKQIIDVRALILDVVEIAKPKWERASKRRGILFDVKVNLAEGVFVLGFPSDIRHAFTNIIFNAVDAMPDGGVFSINSRVEGEVVTIEFCDTGMGMTDEVREKIFDPFYTTKGSSGTGMGMSEVYGIIKRHKGKISVESGVGRGTIITIRMPCQTKFVHRPGKALASILVVGGEDYVLDILEEIISELGCTIITTGNIVDRVLAQIKQNDIRIVIINLETRALTGLDTAQKIKEIEKSTEIIFITDFALNAPQSRQIEALTDQVINKPIAREKIEYAISHAKRKIKNRKN